MAVATAPTAGTVAATPAAGARRAAVRSRIERFRELLLGLLVAGAVLGLVTAAIVLAAGAVAYNRYDRIVSKGVASVDAAQDARADLLDSAGANADELALTDANARGQARTRAQQAWTRFKEDLRRSWANRSDQTQGEFRVFDAADAAETDYAANIGAMNAAVDANRPDDARTAFQNAYNVLVQRALPALGGLESVKLEDIRADYSTTSSTLRGWLIVEAVVSAAFIVAILAALYFTRQMHARVTWELLLALLLAVGIGAWVGYQLHRADVKAKVLVSDAYEMAANVRDEVAWISQENALESMALFDPANANTDFQAISEYDVQVGQLLCGSQDCTKGPPFVANPQTGDTIDPSVVATANNDYSKLGLTRVPLVANVHFAGEAHDLEQARLQYRTFLATDADLQSKINANNASAAAAENAGTGEQQFSATVQAFSAVESDARRVFDQTWHSTEDAARIAEYLAAGEVLAALLVARGLWRRRQLLFVSGRQ